jgi:hypothetical protein
VIAADYQQLLARRGIPSGQIVVLAAIADIHALDNTDGTFTTEAANRCMNGMPPAARKENMELRGIVPAIVPAPPPEPFAVQVIIVDWLYREVDGLAEIKMPVLQHIAGHRNREVYEYLELTHDVRDSRAATIYSA